MTIRIIETEAFNVYGNFIMIRHPASEIFYGLKFSLKHLFKAEFLPKSKAWYLPEDRLQEWLEFEEEKYEWTVSDITYKEISA